MMSINRGLQGEQMMFSSLFAPFDVTTPLTAAPLNRAVDELDASAPLMASDSEHGPKRGNLRKSLEAEANDASTVAFSKKRLVAANFDGKNVANFLPLQAVVADEVLAFKELREDDAKIMMLPYWQIEAFRAANRERMQEERGRCKALAGPFFISMECARRQQVRTEQRIALLRCIEALRLFGAEHDGRLPASLAEVPVPVPDDPFTGKPFQYHLDGSTATLRGAAPHGMETNPLYNRLYQITTKK